MTKFLPDMYSHSEEDLQEFELKVFRELGENCRELCCATINIIARKPALQKNPDCRIKVPDTTSSEKQVIKIMDIQVLKGHVVRIL
jgi:hypothetical protein